MQKLSMMSYLLTHELKLPVTWRGQDSQNFFHLVRHWVADQSNLNIQSSNLICSHYY